MPRQQNAPSLTCSNSTGDSSSRRLEGNGVTLLLLPQEIAPLGNRAPPIQEASDRFASLARGLATIAWRHELGGVNEGSRA